MKEFTPSTYIEREFPQATAVMQTKLLQVTQHIFHYQTKIDGILPKSWCGMKDQRHWNLDDKDLISSLQPFCALKLATTNLSLKYQKLKLVLLDKNTHSWIHSINYQNYLNIFIPTL